MQFAIRSMQSQAHIFVFLVDDFPLITISSKATEVFKGLFESWNTNQSIFA